MRKPWEVDRRETCSKCATGRMDAGVPEVDGLDIVAITCTCDECGWERKSVFSFSWNEDVDGNECDWNGKLVH